MERRLRALGLPGGPWTLAALLAVQLGLVALYALDWRLPIGALFLGALVLGFIEKPLYGLGLLIAARLMDTSSNAFLRIGHVNIGMFEPVLLLALGALAVRIVYHRQEFLLRWPWQAPYFLFLGLVVLSLAWSAKRSEGIQEVISIGVVLANTLLILSFVREPRDFLFIVNAWIAASALIGLFSFAADLMGMGSTGPWQAAAGGGRETGLGQQPNWYAMNLMFIVHTTFGMALVQKKPLYRLLYVLLGLLIFVSQMRSGSRGGTYALLIGGTVTALAFPLFRKWFLRFLGFAVALFGVAMTVNLGSTSKALTRIYQNIDVSPQSIRLMNWEVCIREFLDTHGIGIGAGGYTTLLAKYNWFLYESTHRYPHGIPWGLLAHYGIPGLLLFAWLAWVVFQMTRRLTRWTRGSSLEIFAWTMPATMLSYAAWSFVEFEYNEKPFWEFLALFTALYLLVERKVRAGEALPPMPGDVTLPWKRAGSSPAPSGAEPPP